MPPPRLIHFCGETLVTSVYFIYVRRQVAAAAVWLMAQPSCFVQTQAKAAAMGIQQRLMNMKEAVLEGITLEGVEVKPCLRLEFDPE